MKSKLTGKYMIVFSISVFLVIGVSLILIYNLLFSSKVENQDKPQYLVTRFEEYIDFDTMIISDEGKEILLNNNFWVQIIDDKGNVLKEYNVPDGILKSYNAFQISSYAMDTGEADSQTIFIKQSVQDTEKGIILGCESSEITKVSLSVQGELKNVIAVIVCVFICVCVIVEIGAGFYFSKNISKPVSRIIKNINKLEQEGESDSIKSNDKLFKSVFDSLENLRLRLARADKERKNTENQRNEWISNVSHDMKSPLTSIMGYAEIMTYGNINISQEDRDIYCKKIYKHAESINELVEELKFSRLLENGQIKLMKERVNICELLIECIYNVPSNYDSERVRYEFAKEEICAVIDRYLIKRCFTNIICNAVVHNNADVDMIIRCHQGKKVSIEIEDNGKGMSEQELNKIFTRYYRGDEAKSVAGSGLGLAIANDIIKVHSGFIEVESEYGKGTKFKITL